MSRARVPASRDEPWAWLVLLPIMLTVGYYVLPGHVQRSTMVQFLPQAGAYLALFLWASRTPEPLARLGLWPARLREGARWGIPTGLVLGVLNVTVILWLVPQLGSDIGFLRQTPHAQVPSLLMLPWLITLIAMLVELNFRGFLLGRLHVLWQQHVRPEYHKVGTAAVVLVTSGLFAFDPFMVATFKQLHWIAVWDGIVWGILRISRGTLAIPIVAHAFEVIILYSVLKVMLRA